MNKNEFQKFMNKEIKLFRTNYKSHVSNIIILNTITNIYN